MRIIGNYIGNDWVPWGYSSWLVKCQFYLCHLPSFSNEHWTIFCDILFSNVMEITSDVASNKQFMIFFMIL